MRERVQLYGGSFEAARTGGRGFRVAASIPLDAVTA
jgi:signal transduction histidine kinase